MLAVLAILAGKARLTGRAGTLEALLRALGVLRRSYLVEGGYAGSALTAVPAVECLVDVVERGGAAGEPGIGQLVAGDAVVDAPAGGLLVVGVVAGAAIGVVLGEIGASHGEGRRSVGQLGVGPGTEVLRLGADLLLGRSAAVVGVGVVGCGADQR